MIVFSIYSVFFLILLLRLKSGKKKYTLNLIDLRFILFGLLIYCLCNALSKALIYYDLKIASFQILNHHFLLLGICFFLYFKLMYDDDV